MIEHVGNNCVGCGACASICEKHCIEMVVSQEGFLFPCIDYEKCVQCGLCEKICPALNNDSLHNIADAKILGIRSKEEYREDILKSASAGVFFFLAKTIIEQGGFVFGAVFDETWTVKHICGRTIEDVKRMQNSKYVQSDTTEVFAEIKRILREDSNASVLFCGTPCQCLAVKSFLGIEYENLYLVDIVCHGVPSPLAFKKYLKYLERIRKEPIVNYEFRYKYKGWNYHGYMSSYVKYNSHYWPTVTDPYMRSFLKMHNYRESCYTCQYNTSKKCADISLADFSGVRDVAPEFFTKAGCSEVYIHSDKGEKLMGLIKQYIEIIPLNSDDLKNYSLILKRERVRPTIRDNIYDGIVEMDDKAYVETKLMKSVSMKGLVRFYTPYNLRKIVSRIINLARIN